ncbi:hypothetical protein CMUST_06800 [Corynebacterium mustelae]|uniref:Uncharacterized protein n=1 Tax=Corynebacterium mustelae TaxID=571915 RepID=A0A0G3GX33_9CORY|nr:hypothetical protein [Corynebacterium mustelae]AKK05694.1 hypothetical protein CMUST_06800 [Corynebacterium mustelae]
MNEWLSLAIGTGAGGFLSWMLTHLYHRKSAKANAAAIAELKHKLDESHRREEELRIVIEHNEQRRRIFDVRNSRFSRYLADPTKPVEITINDSYCVELRNISGKDLKQVTLASIPYTECASIWGEGFFYQDAWLAGDQLHFNNPDWLWETDGIGMSWFEGSSYYPKFVYAPFDPSKNMAEYRTPS